MTPERLQCLVSYSPESGEFSWLIGGHGRAVGRRAGTLGSDGGVVLKIEGRQYPGHRVAWCLKTGEWPERKMIFRDGDRANCAWANLALVAHKPKTIAERGGRVYCTRGCWHVEIIDADGKYRNSFDTESRARADYSEKLRFRAEFFEDPEGTLRKSREKAQRRVLQLRSTTARVPDIPASEIEPKNARPAAMMKLYEPINLRARLYAARRDLEAQRLEDRERLAFASLERTEARLKLIERAIDDVERREFDDRYTTRGGSIRDDLLDFDFYDDAPWSDVKTEADIAADAISGGGFDIYKVND
jgi:hypothetical protein